MGNRGVIFLLPVISSGASGGDGGIPPLLFDDSFLRFQEKVLLKFSPNLRENPSKILRIWEKIHLKSSELGENPSEILQIYEKNHLKSSNFGRKFI
jgi:hypothetical protein